MCVKMIVKISYIKNIFKAMLCEYGDYEVTVDCTVQSRFFESRFFEAPFIPTRCAVMKGVSMSGTEFC
jgi:hypothetical protein